MTTKATAYPVRLPASIKAAAERRPPLKSPAPMFVASAVAEKVAALRAADYFIQRRATPTGRHWTA